MATPRFLLPEGLISGALVALPAPIEHHARRVLRLQPGDPLVLFDGKGQEFDATLLVDPQNASRSLAQLGAAVRVSRDACLAITLVQALSAVDKVDWLVEKSVELGVHRLILAPSARSVVRLDGARRARREQHWRDIAAAACAQCGRNLLPTVELAADLATALTNGRGAVNWVLDPRATAGLEPAAGNSASFAVGPEGGFTPAEIAAAQALGYHPLRLGARVLRTETAGLVATSALLALHGEYR